MKKILLYGFKPYADYTDNVTEKIIDKYPAHGNINKTVFDVKFDPNMFNKVLRLTRPEIIIGLGQHPKARKLRLERAARNTKGNPGKDVRLISKKGPACRYVNLTMPVNEWTTITYDAGHYVCNYSMYLMGEYCENNKCKFAFIHVPEKYSVKKALDYLHRSLKSIANV